MKTETTTNQPTPLDALFRALNSVDAVLATPPQTPHHSFDSSTPPLIHSSTHPLPARKPRNGKIARLPKPVRDVVNRMLFQNISQDRIVAALDEMGICVNQQNISNWKNRGGYREWCLAQEHALNLRLHQDNLVDLLRRHDASELPEVGLQAAATQLSRFFLTPAALQLLASDPREYERRVSMLARISTHVAALQKSRDDSVTALGNHHNPDRIRHETRTSLNTLTDAFTSQIPDSPQKPNIPHRNSLPNPAELFHFSNRAPESESHQPCSLSSLLALFSAKRGDSGEASPPAPSTQPQSPGAFPENPPSNPV